MRLSNKERFNAEGVHDVHFRVRCKTAPWHRDPNAISLHLHATKATIAQCYCKIVLIMNGKTALPIHEPLFYGAFSRLHQGYLVLIRIQYFLNLLGILGLRQSELKQQASFLGI